MYTDNAEATYCQDRIDRSNALASASNECCAKLSHEAMAALYRHRLAGLVKRGPATVSQPAAAV